MWWTHESSWKRPDKGQFDVAWYAALLVFGCEGEKAQRKSCFKSQLHIIALPKGNKFYMQHSSKFRSSLSAGGFCIPEFGRRSTARCNQCHTTATQVLRLKNNPQQFAFGTHLNHVWLQLYIYIYNLSIINHRSWTSSANYIDEKIQNDKYHASISLLCPSRSVPSFEGIGQHLCPAKAAHCTGIWIQSRKCDDTQLLLPHGSSFQKAPEKIMPFVLVGGYFQKNNPWMKHMML